MQEQIKNEKNFDDASKPDANDFSALKRKQFLISLSKEKSGAFENLDQRDFLRFVGVPDRLIIDELNAVDVTNRLKKAIDMGVLYQVEGRTWSYAMDRPIVLVKVGGEIVPFYRSSEGTGGVKVAGEWYPFFGIGNNFWLIKGSNDDFKTSYNNPVLKKIQNVLNETFNWDHALDSKKGSLEGVHPLAQTQEGLDSFFPRKELNKIAFNDESIENISINTEESANQRLKILSRMIERYPVEILKEIFTTNKKVLSQLGYKES